MDREDLEPRVGSEKKHVASTTSASRTLQPSATVYANSPVSYSVAVVSLLVVSIALLYEVRQLCLNNNILLVSLNATTKATNEVKPIVWVYSKGSDQSHLRHVIESFRRYGYRLGERADRWSVLWSHDYPFTELASDMRELKPGQVVNHFPGSGYITNKASLSTDRSIRELPLTFRLPAQKDEFLQNIDERPHVMWVQKNRDHRGIHVVDPVEVAAAADDEETFVQELIANPLLIDGKKFDIGVYVAMTSLEPLRVYVYRGDVLLRFCARPYDALHFNASDLDSYVVGDDYTPIWDMPSLARYYVSDQLSMKTSLDVYLRTQMVADSGALWSEVERIVASVYTRKAEAMRRSASRWPRMGRFFELVRFDFVLDDALGVHLLEANMSPNLSSAHFPANGPFYEQLLFSLFSLVGLGASNSADDWRFLDRATSVLPSDCPVQPVDRRCEQPASLCAASCLSTAHKQAFRAALWEHLHRKQFARLVPRPDASVEPEANMTEADRIMAQWYAAKCMQDSEWCR
ncbi:hypothetical protein HPB51_009280 [Rhipicephalus microplus]|uniref:Tubulin polyglutamylase ttll4 n=1 Tax=Rhipicephalus microplus TaxID=6941 RepID=A0A9J6F1E3_RHIMP|nr:probable tubulin polyglutamylase ttll-15 [Rhipicephalus microplus]KAH8040024.1 hypothetical protein HPB51_009280 [Rhipicephalus microplus]